MRGATLLIFKLLAAWIRWINLLNAAERVEIAILASIGGAGIDIGAAGDEVSRHRFYIVAPCDQICAIERISDERIEFAERRKQSRLRIDGTACKGDIADANPGKDQAAD